MTPKFECKYCRNDSYLVKLVSPLPAAFGLYCKACGKWQKWLNKAERNLYIPTPRQAVNPCVCCGEEVPEGRQVCPTCEQNACTTVVNVGRRSGETARCVLSNFLKKAERHCIELKKTALTMAELRLIVADMVEQNRFDEL